MTNTARDNRRMAGMLRTRLPDARLQDVHDPRSHRGRRWPIHVLLQTVIVAMLAGAKSLANLERLTADLSVAMRRVVRVGRRVADTTVRDLLCGLSPDDLRRALHRLVRAAHRRKALDPVGLPFGVVSMDGKATSLPSCVDHYAQRQSPGKGQKLVGMVRTVTCCLVSSAAKVCIDAIPIHAQTNEMGAFASSLASLVQTYGRLRLFRLVTYDAGACSFDNASSVRAHGLAYLFALKSTQPTLHSEARRLLENMPASSAHADSEDIVGNTIVVRRVYLTEEMGAFGDWNHLRTVVRNPAPKACSLWLCFVA